jgi:hypothetical protein
MKIKTLLKVVVLLGLVSMLPGCASAAGTGGVGGWFKGLFTVKAADTIKAADKINGVENANVKVADTATADVKAVDFSRTETTSYKAGGAISSTTSSDPLVLNTIAGGLFGMMGSLIFYMFLTIRQKDKQIANLMKGQQAFIEQQEKGQCKYIEMLEKIAMAVIDSKLKEAVK